MKLNPSNTRRLFLSTSIGSRLAFALYAMAMLGALGAITALIERAAA